MAISINWDVEIAVLQDLSVTVPASHRLAMQAFLAAFQTAEALDQKVLTARMAAEGVSALENLGALAWAIGVNDVMQFYESVTNNSLRAVFGLPNKEDLQLRLSNDDIDIIRASPEPPGNPSSSLNISISLPSFERVPAYGPMVAPEPMLTISPARASIG